LLYYYKLYPIILYPTFLPVVTPDTLLIAKIIYIFDELLNGKFSVGVRGEKSELASADVRVKVATLLLTAIHLVHLLLVTNDAVVMLALVPIRVAPVSEAVLLIYINPCIVPVAPVSLEGIHDKSI